LAAVDEHAAPRPCDPGVPAASERLACQVAG
jgi:hypothetical protein